ncbi:methyl-viologen-reducing hydrogenase subunit delta [Desulfocarbo indianensis]|nr:methyl-viologen-reducing hydrogenase subunit delta [Desulfocarbo indianensis]
MSNDKKFTPKIIGMICNWCCYGGADLCGVSRFQYPPYIRLIRIMCSGRVDLQNVLQAFANGADGMFIGGCHLDDCHYITHGNYDALSMVHIAKKLLAHIGINPNRLRLEWVSAGEGIRFANIMNEYGAEIMGLGPLGKGEGIDLDEMKFKLDAVSKLVPYIRLVERERLRIPTKKEEKYEAFYNGEEFDRLFNELILDKLAISEITSLLRVGPLSTGEISEKLSMSPSEVAKHMIDSSRYGLVRYDPGQNSYALA